MYRIARLYIAPLSIALLLAGCGTMRQQPSTAPTSLTDLETLIRQVPTPVVQPQTVQTTITPTYTGVVAKIDSLCHTSLFAKSQLGIYIYDMTTDTPVYALGEKMRMRPASNQKLITAITALKVLGHDYTFKTHLYLTGEVSGGELTGDVYIAGGMDPLLSKTDVRSLAAAIRKAGINKIKGNTYTDLSLKDDLQYGWGWCWDDDYGPLSALMVDGKDEFADAWKAALKAEEITITNSNVSAKEYTEPYRPTFTITHRVDEMLTTMMKESDNIMAECLFYQIAASKGKKKASRKQAAEQINSLISLLNLNPDDYKIADGSGLSLYNYATPELMVKMLNYAYTQPRIIQNLYCTLPIAGVDGTLKKRMKETEAMDNVHAKTGSVDGVSTLCGYLTTTKGHTLSFAIFNQGVSPLSEARQFQDEICTLLCQ